MTRKQKYREFLRTDFWKALSAEKKLLVKKCERCGSKYRLQCHHRFYRKNWFDTALEDLEVLCRSCHQEHHGLVIYVRFFPYREDEEFNKAIHRTGHLNRMVQRGAWLRPRDEAFLKNTLRRFPDTPKDTCMSFHVGQVYEMQAFMKGLKKIEAIRSMESQ